MRVSVVINTLNRAGALEVALDALRHLDYEAFEVIVVNGPSTDDTAEVLSRYADRIKVAACPEANLSKSRNLGLALAAGQIVAFLDDDAYPDPGWLDQLVAGYDSDEIAAVGGPVLDHTGARYQVRYLRSNRFGTAARDSDAGINPTYLLSAPGAERFPSLLGANSSFRRTAVTEIGGFDEEYEYFLDETDVCVRLVDRGLVVRLVDDGFVYHKFLPSTIRKADRIARVRYSVVKNSVYFALRHALPTTSFAAVCEGIADMVRGHRSEMRGLWKSGVIELAELVQFEDDVVRGSDLAFEHAMRGPRTRPPAWFAAPPPFLPYARVRLHGPRLHVAFVTREHPPGPVNGIGRLFAAEARALGRRGHFVHVVTVRDDHETVDYEDGVWVHRSVPVEPEHPAEDVPIHIETWATTAAATVEAIDARRPLDAVVVPSWDSEGLVLLKAPPCPVVLGVYTPLPTVLDLDREIGSGDCRSIHQLLVAERWCLEHADFVLASGEWTFDEVQRGHGSLVEPHRRLFAPHGLPDMTAGVEPERPEGGFHLLFVGRFEPRKGIDVLLDCLPELLDSFPDLVVTLAGEDVHGAVRRFTASIARGQARRVNLPGRVGDDRLLRLYAGCDLFVAPSRYESFGLVLVEAMMFGKPVVASRVGGMQWIVEHGVTGLLVEPGDAAAFRQAVVELVGSSELRTRMGIAARARFEAELSEEHMGSRLEQALLQATTSAASR
jgi:glycogen(starch) synthase